MLNIFPEHFIKEIKLNQQTIGAIIDQWPANLRLRYRSDETIYDCFPFTLVSTAFGVGAEINKLRTLNAVCGLLSSSIMAFDDAIDTRKNFSDIRLTKDGEHEAFSSLTILAAIAKQHEAYTLLYRLFPPSALFWQHFQSYLMEHTSACATELMVATGQMSWDTYTEETARSLITGKNGMSRVIPAGLAEIQGDYSTLADLERMLEHHYVATQVYDDLCDWKEDLRDGNPSLLLSRVLNEWPDRRTPQVIAQAIYYEGHAQYVLEYALRELELSDHAAQFLQNSHWQRINNEARQRCQALLNDISKIVKGNLKRVEKQERVHVAYPPAEGSWLSSAWESLDYVLEQWQRGFGELRHTMYFARSDGFDVKDEYQSGDVFQRALVLESLCEANPYVDGQLTKVVSCEADYLLSRAWCEGVRAWGYFPDLKEMPPDADTLAQMIQALLKAGHRDQLKQHCEKALDTLITDNHHPDGSFETWIVPAVPTNDEQARQQYYVRHLWGEGPDCDVIANLLLALHHYDAQRFQRVILSGLDYLESQQQCDGSWTSTWYKGPYYGTYVCMRLLRHLKPESHAVARGSSFLRETQRKDGGWGESDPLSTALALLALLSDADSQNDIYALRGLHTLADMQLDMAAWTRHPFFRMDVRRAQGEAGTRLLYWGSRTITATFAFRAFIAGHVYFQDSVKLTQAK